MDISWHRTIPFSTAFNAARNSPLEEAGDKKVLFYRNADFRLVDYFADELNPVALYILKKNLDFQFQLREYLLRIYGVDTLQLPGVLHLRQGDKIVGMIPPYVEIARENVSLVPRDGDRQPPARQTLQVPLLIDGFHRVWLARELGLPVKCLVVRNTDQDYPYASYPVAWSDVKVHDEVPKVKKYYRRQDPYTFMRPLDVLRCLPPGDKEYGR